MLKGNVQAYKVSFNVAESEFIAIMGASGSGKTTLLNVPVSYTHLLISFNIPALISLNDVTVCTTVCLILSIKFSLFFDNWETSKVCLWNTFWSSFWLSCFPKYSLSNLKNSGRWIAVSYTHLLTGLKLSLGLKHNKSYPIFLTG